MYYENKDLLFRNLQLLKGFKLDFSEREDSQEKNYSVKLNDTSEGVPSLLIENDKNQFFIHSKYRPLEEAKRLTRDISITTKNIVVFGIGLGYHIKEILKRTAYDTKILIIIPDYLIFKELLGVWDYSEILSDPRVSLEKFENKTSTKAIIDKQLDWKKINSIEFLYIENYKNLFYDMLEDTLQALRETISTNYINENTKAYFSNDWQKNYFKNMAHIFQSTPLTFFHNEFKNVPAVIVSAGPSLNKNVQLLKTVKDKVLILSTDSALKVLLKNNIKPHLVFTIDGGFLTYEKFRGIDYSDIPMVFQTLSNEMIVEEHKGHKIFFSTGEDIYRLYKEKNLDTFLPIGGSVATAAFSMACYIGADPVVFIGQDLAFTEERTHALGTMYDEEIFQQTHQKKLSEAKKKHYINVKGNYEDKVITDPVYRSYLTWFQDAIKTQLGLRRFINATEGGAFIEGTEVSSLEMVLQKYCKKDFPLTHRIQTILDREGPFSNEGLKKILEQHKKSFKELVNIKKRAKLACKYLDELAVLYNQNKIHSKSIKQLLSKLDEIDKDIKNQEKSTVFIELIIQRKIVEADYSLYRGEKPNETEQEKGLRIIHGNLIFYNGIVESIDLVEEFIAEYLEKMQFICGGANDGKQSK